MATEKFIQISAVPANKRAAAQRRVRNEGIVAVALTNDQFRVKASGSFRNPLRSEAVLNEDYYEVRTYESDGELFATCTCPFGQRGEDGDTNICKHIEAALTVRPVSIHRSRSLYTPPPVFQSGKIIIDIGRNEIVATSSAVNTDGTPFSRPTTRRRRLDTGTGQNAFNKLLTFIDNTF